MAQIFEKPSYDDMNLNKYQETLSSADSMDLDWQYTNKPVQTYNSKPLYVNDNQENDYLPKPLQQQQSTSLIPTNNYNQNMIPGIPTSSSIHKPIEVKPKAVIRSGNDIERLSVAPLNTLRLQPTRYKTKNAIMSILKHGEVVIEFTKYKAKYNSDRVTDICWISGDGMRIIIYQPDPGRGLAIGDCPPELPATSADNIFSYDNLPAKHWKKYVYAARFVGLVKSKTPKVTYYSTQAKCALMETLEDFEACFYNGEKVTKSPSEGLKVQDKHGRQLNLNMELDQAQALIEHQQTCFEHCRKVCEILEQTEQTTNHSCFPIVIGRRPTNDLKPQHVTTHRRDVNAIALHSSTPKSQQQEANSINFTMSTMLSSVNYDSKMQQQQQIIAAQQNVAVKRVNIPDIGVATEVGF